MDRGRGYYNNYNNSFRRYESDSKPSQRPFSGYNRNRQSNSNYNERFSHHPRNRYAPYGEAPSRSFGSRRGHFRGSNKNAIQIPKDETEENIDRFTNYVRSKGGTLGEIVFLQNEGDTPYVAVQNAVDCTNGLKLKFNFDSTVNKYTLSVNDEILASGVYPNKQDARSSLADDVYEYLRQRCFHILKKKNYEEISNDNLTSIKTSPQKDTNMTGGIAHQMMLKMGWGGKGLGASEQGIETSLTICQNISRQGLGSSNIFNEISKILEEFASSTKLTILAFDPEFTKEERAHIHKLCQRYNLKSKSEGKDEARRLTVSKKIRRYDIVRELLKIGGENQCYTLTLPSFYKDLWNPETKRFCERS